MEFFYEEQVACIEDDKINDSHTKETGSTENTENNELQSRDDKTNGAFQKLEEEVNKRYEKTTSAFKKLVIEKDDGIEINLPISNETTETAQKYLKKLDENIHSVESLAQSYWSKMKLRIFGLASVASIMLQKMTLMTRMRIRKKMKLLWVEIEQKPN